MDNFLEKMKGQTFGVELELSGVNCTEVLGVLTEVFGYNSNNTMWKVYDNNGLAWSVVSDNSIIATNGKRCELVTPPLTYNDIEVLQDVVRRLRKAGAICRPDKQCGVHIHIGADGHDAKSLKKLVFLVTSHQELLFKACGTSVERQKWCKPLPQILSTTLRNTRDLNYTKLWHIWYHCLNAIPSYNKYNTTRYHILNLHTTYLHGQTVEFRFFNFANRGKGLHAGHLKAFIQLSLAMNEMSKELARASGKPCTITGSERTTFGIWLDRLHLKGSEFKTAREFFLSNLDVTHA